MRIRLIHPYDFFTLSAARNDWPETSKTVGKLIEPVKYGDVGIYEHERDIVEMGGELYAVTATCVS